MVYSAVMQSFKILRKRTVGYCTVFEQYITVYLSWLTVLWLGASLSEITEEQGMLKFPPPAPASARCQTNRCRKYIRNHISVFLTILTLIDEYFRRSSPEKGENFTDSGSSTPKFKYTQEVYLNMNSGVLELKLHKVHFGDKFSEASRACEVEENLSAKCTECSYYPNVNEEVTKYADAELARRGVLGLPLS